MLKPLCAYFMKRKYIRGEKKSFCNEQNRTEMDLTIMV